MHSYNTDSDERVKIPFYIAVLSIVLAYILHNYILGPISLKWNISFWWLDTPAVMGMYFVLLNAFDKWIWKLGFLRKVGIIKTLDISGKWFGYLESSFDKFQSQMAAEVIIEQTWTSILVKFRSSTSCSYSVTASLLTGDPRGVTLSFEYQNEPICCKPETMHIHRGFNRLILTETDKFEGEYYTGRSRNTHGIMQLTRGITANSISG